MFPQSEAMNVNFGTSSKDICFCTEFSSSSDGKDLYGNSIDVIEFIVSEVNNNLIEAIILSSL